MLDTLRIVQLYENVLIHDIYRHQIPDSEIKNGIECLQEVYKKTSLSLGSARSQIADYNNPAHRCAYLHKYAAFHTAMVRDMMYETVQSNFRLFYNSVFSAPRYSICCLGGGPGTDVIGVLAALHHSFSYFDSSVNIVDYMINWSVSFDAILRELGNGFYGAFGNNTSYFLNWRYLQANLLKRFSPDVDNAISSASLVTMIKFASAASCIDTENMINNIFTTMKPGAILFFIDNDAGGYHELIMRAAKVHRFISIFGPVRHENYTNLAVKTVKFGYTSCCKSTITVHVLQKPAFYNYRSVPNLNGSYPSPILANPWRRVGYSPVNNYNPPLLHSPLTPYILRPPGAVDNNPPLLHSPSSPYTPSGPVDNYSPLLDSPLTPYRMRPSGGLYLQDSVLEPHGVDYLDNSVLEPRGFENTDNSILGPHGVGYAEDSAFADDTFIPDRNNNDFIASPILEIPQTPNFVQLQSHLATPMTRNIVNSPYAGMENLRPPIYTPNTRSRRKKKGKRGGCFPTKLWRNNLSKKFNNLKAQASSLLKPRPKIKKNHPVFRL